MRLTAVLKLKIGDRVLTGDHHFTRFNSAGWKGTVLQVTPKGGVLLGNLMGRDGPESGQRWFAYNHLIEKLNYRDDGQELKEALKFEKSEGRSSDDLW